MVAKHTSSESRKTCAVDEILKMDHLKQKNQTVLDSVFFFRFPKNVRHFVIFACIKNRMICAIAINILNLKPFNFFVSDDPSPRFH